MASKKKNSKHQDNKKKTKGKKDSESKGVFGVNPSRISPALIGAAVGEIAQAALTRMAQSSENSKVGDVATDARHSVQEAAVTIKDVVTEVTPSVKSAVDAVKTVVEDVKPAVATAISTLKETTHDAAQSTGEAIEHTVDRAKDALHSTKLGKKKNGKKKS